MQKSLTAVFDDRDRGKDCGEEENHDDGSGEEIRHVATGRASAGGGAGGLEAAAHPTTDEQPEDDRRGQRADDAVLLADEADEFALAKG